MKRFLRIFLAIITLFTFICINKNGTTEVVAATSDSYYANVDTSSGQNLQSSLTTIINSGAVTKSYDYLWTAYKTTDCKPGTNIIWDMYSNYEFECGGSKQGANYSGEGDGYNREHSVPQSWFSEKTPMKTDLFHVYPTDGYVNNRRSNYVFGEVGTATYTSENGSKLGSSSHSLYSGTVFEPIDEYKGDFARTYFYMATRYSSQVGSWSGNASIVFTGSYPYLTDYAIDLFAKWSHDDPVSEKETARNDAVYTIQNNRNPFIDHPEYIDIIFENDYADVEVDQTEVDSVISAINNLPTTITLDDETTINACLALYNALNYAEKALVTNYSTLSAAVTALNALKNQDSGDDNTGTGSDSTTTVTGESFDIDFTTISGLGAYASNVTGIVDGKNYLFTNGYQSGSDVRLGSNKNVTLPSKYQVNVSGTDGSALEFSYDIENAKSITFNNTLSYGTISNWYILFSIDGGSTFSLVSSGSGYSATMTGTLESSATGRFALVIVGTKPRIQLGSAKVICAESEPIVDVSNIYVSTSLSIDYKYLNEEYTITKMGINFYTTITQEMYNTDGSFYMLIIPTSELNSSSISSLMGDSDVYDFAALYGGEVVELDFSTSLKAKGSIVVTDADCQYTAVLVSSLDGPYSFSHETTYSVMDAVNYYLDNNIITDSVMLAVLNTLK